LVLKLLLDTWGDFGESQSNSPEQLPFEVSVGKRVKAPQPGSVVEAWVNQGFVRFVRCDTIYL